MSEELVQIQQNTAIQAAVNTSSWGDDEDEIKPRYIRLKGPKSISAALENFKNGQFVDTEIGRSWEKMDIVILQIALTRKFQSPYKTGEQRELYCRSRNRKVPVTTDDRFEAVNADCPSCPYGQLAWANYNKKTGEGKPNNPCEQEVDILFIEKKNPKQPYLYTFNGNARATAEAMRSSIISRSKDVQDSTGRRPEMYEYVVTMETERTKTGSYIPKFTNIDELTKERAEADFGEAYQLFVLARNQAFAARMNAVATQEALAPPQKVVETPAQVATKPVVAEFLPPASKRKVGTKPTYVPPIAVTPESDDVEPEVSI